MKLFLFDPGRLPTQGIMPKSRIPLKWQKVSNG
jgi:hypothetical protein